jgi:NTP pyrophosphatase (non-canonical NTP hydrolase)
MKVRNLVRIREDIHAAIDIERQRQERQWPGQSCSDDIPIGRKLSILFEEVGEVAHELTEWYETAFRSEVTPGMIPLPENLRTELVQVAAVAVAWIESLS